MASLAVQIGVEHVVVVVAKQLQAKSEQIFEKLRYRQRTLTVLLYGLSPVLQVYIQVLHYIQKPTYLLCWSSQLLLNWRPAVQ